MLPTFERAPLSTKTGFLFPAPGLESSHSITCLDSDTGKENRETLRAGERSVRSLSRLFSIEGSGRALGKRAEFSEVIQFQCVRAELLYILTGSVQLLPLTKISPSWEGSLRPTIHTGTAAAPPTGPHLRMSFPTGYPLSGPQAFVSHSTCHYCN